MAGDITFGYWARMLQYVGLTSTAFNGSTSGSTLLKASAIASGTLTLPAATDTLVGKATTDTLTNKTISAGTFTGNIYTGIKASTADPAPATTGLVDIAGLGGQTLVAGATYKFKCVLSGLADGTSGISYAFKYTTATLTSIESAAIGYTATAVSTQHTTTTTDATLLFDKAAAITLTVLEGTMVVNAGGTVKLQAGLHTGTTAAAVYVGSTMEFWRIA